MTEKSSVHFDFTPKNWIGEAGQNLKLLSQDVRAGEPSQNPEDFIEIATPEVILNEFLSGGIKLVELKKNPEKFYKIWQFLDSKDAESADFQPGELESLKKNFKIPGKIAGVDAMFAEIYGSRDSSNEYPNTKIYFESLSKLEKRIFDLENLLNLDCKQKDFEKKIENSDLPELELLFRKLKKEIKKQQKSTIRGWLKKNFSDEKKNRRGTGWLNSPESEPYFGEATLRLLDFFVEGKTGYSRYELVNSDDQTYLSRHKRFISILEKKKVDETISSEEENLLKFLKEEKSTIDDTPVWKILKEDLLNPEITKIKEWVRGLVARKTI